MTQILRDKRATRDRPGDIALDSLSWAASQTLMAAKRTGRICRGAEIGPLYVAIRRWRRVTGERAVQAENGVDFEALELEEMGACHER